MNTRLLALLPLLLSAACLGKADEDDDGDDDVLGILITPEEVVVPVGQQVQLKATGLTDDRDSVDLTSSVRWQSSDEDVLSVSNDLDSEGLASGLAAGTVRVEAEYDGMESVPIDVIVTDADVSRLAVYPDELELGVGDEVQLVATAWFTDGSESDATGQVRWVTGDGTVATISQDGLLRAAGSGSTEITVEWSGVQSEVVPVTVSSSSSGGGGGDGPADLVITAASGSISDGYLDLSVTIKNQGETAASEFWVDAFIDSGTPDSGTPDIGDVGDDFAWVTWLSAGSSTTVELTAYTGSGSHSVAILVDTNDDVDESDEGNNLFTTTVGSSGGGGTGGGGSDGPNLAISYFDYIYDYGDIYYGVEIENDGDEAATESFYVDVWVDRDDAPSLYEDGDDWATVYGLSAGASEYIDFWFEGEYCHWCWSWVMVDGYDYVDETDESDNVEGPLDVY